MVNQLTIRNYKSIKDLDIETKRVNIFIGEHNSGKSNILEALNWFSVGSLDPINRQEMFRFKAAQDFFYDFDVTKPVTIQTNELSLMIRYAKNNHGAILGWLEGLIYKSDLWEDPTAIGEWSTLQSKYTNFLSFRLELNGNIDLNQGYLASIFRTYIFKRLKTFGISYAPYLNPPFGENIPALLISNKEYQESVRSIFKGKGFRLMLKPTENDFSMAKDENDELFSYPYQAISETLQRIVFYTLAIESNKNAILILDEPESNTFPMFTNQLGEMMALDSDNQYFIATHNPYLLDALLSKTTMDDLAIFVTKMEKFRTVVKSVPQAKMSELMQKGVDFYSNLDKLTDN